VFENSNPAFLVRMCHLLCDVVGHFDDVLEEIAAQKAKLHASL
jgi:hypothetical protein